MKSLNIHDLLNGLISFLRKIVKRDEKINSKEGMRSKLEEGCSEKIFSKSTVLGRKRNRRKEQVRTENCIIQCVLSSFLFFIRFL